MRDDISREASFVFQSTPTAEARGDYPGGRGSGLPVGARFQSTPPAEARGDDSPPRHRCSCHGSFNPLPPPKRGETSTRTSLRGFMVVVSIHSPLRSEGRRCPCLTSRYGSPVSIHSPRRSEGRPPRPSVCSRRHHACFNPLPPPKRGETASQVEAELLTEPVSIHSPRRSEGRRQSIPSRVAESMFQSTPPAEARGDIIKRVIAAVVDVSIHSPRRSEGRLELQPLAEPSFFVSIHSPRRSEGRRARLHPVRAVIKFQSTPPAEVRGDSCRCFKCTMWCCFNPLPPPKRGETSVR